ncbi:MAG: cellulose synthase operon protein YhjQ/BcsQ [Bryobacterales bacterium]|nr:hypothetical protein [Bryobacteraceae bacterium]MDW8129926.1 cellulose synthase operon protein YhjQ/BcsQ [Bryobacterales bacterium]
METPVAVVLAPEGPTEALLAGAFRSLPVRVLFERWVPVDWTEFLERLAFLEACAVLVDCDHFQDDFPQIAVHVKSLRPPAPAVIAVSCRCDPTAEDRARRGGADGFLSPPFEHALRSLLEDLEAKRLVRKSVNGTLGRTLGMAGVRGGCGTSTLACLLAMALRRVNRQPVLLVDLDPHTGMIGFLTGARTPYSLLDAAENLYRLDANSGRTLVATHSSGMDVLPAPRDPESLRSADPARLRRALRFLRTCYSWLVADLGEIWDGSWCQVREELDELWLVATPGPASLYQARRALQWLRSAGLEPASWRLLVNRTGRSGTSADEVELLVGKRPDMWVPECAELRETDENGGLPGLSGRAGARMLRIAAGLADAWPSPSGTLPRLPWLKALRRESLPRSILKP